MTTVLLDYHHHDLWESMELLCERLGWTLVRPIGMEWFDQEYWNFERAWHGDKVARQYLEPWGSDTNGLRYDKSHDRYQRLVTLDEARDLRPDIVIASVAHNHEGLHRFAKEVGAHFGIHLGNVRFSEIDMREDRWDLAEFGICTTNLPIAPPKPHVVVHQEFNLDHFRHEPAPERDRPVFASFVNCFPENWQAYAAFRWVAGKLAEYDWRVYGSYGSVPEDEYACGNIQPCSAVADAMRDTNVAWHTKQWSDGFGHVIHNWFAVGRPVVGHAEYYRDQLAGPLWQEGVTSIGIDGKSPEEILDVARRLASDGELRQRMGDAAAARFREIVDFDEEEQAIRRMFEAVL